MSWLHCFWGVGTIVSPYIMSYALTHSGWTNGYRTVSYIQFGITLILVLAWPLWKINKTASEAESSAKPLGIKGAFKNKGSSLSADRLYVILCGGSHHDALGEQLS